MNKYTLLLVLPFQLAKATEKDSLNTVIPINQNLTSDNVKANYYWSANLNYSL